MEKIFRKQIGRNFEVYMNDMVVKFNSVVEHMDDLVEVLSELRKHNMHLSIEKCVFDVGGGKFLEFMLTARGIAASPNKLLLFPKRKKEGRCPSIISIKYYRVSSKDTGLLVSASADGAPLLLDDGTGLIELSLTGEFRHHHWKPGMYVMVVGGYVARAGELPMIKVHKIVDLSSSPDRDAMWYLEVVEAYKLFYQPLVEEFT
uniref:Retrovirus-related Pol polyprotein from transposon opus n=1 Tax=Cajanus cajan TaxID=3821 RepID=A0A151TNJ9_CAJCA|nr:hypothetical protein KK1_022256 [Cajanus cajan]